jgi:hypothetical protein
MPLPTLALDDWKPVSRLGALVSISFYILFLLYAAAMGPRFLFLDFANLMIHEAGHPLFGILGGGEDGFGHTLMVLGGTLLELIVPFVCAVYFFFSAKPMAPRSVVSGSSRIFCTSPITWPMLAPLLSLSSAATKATGPFSSPTGMF